MADAAGIRPGELVLDLGAGTGHVAAALRRRGARVLAVELDARLAAALRRRFADDPAVRVVEDDARRVAGAFFRVFVERRLTTGRHDGPGVRGILRDG